ncbi:6-phospho-beta-glucosidase [Jatrophihabitans endophyticus]|uniref:6-phospho-beta-glucosidase n=1 Tax=Jatrophihabitans endophyticus TaxID=1206085 RepID=A0A1M5PK32_9ACTN|nr:6-phospho-beta-glucosidase [Jatrophihabitans endophyticus]SHH01869.1 6-phospho-beta-glucosidase [Jatrophihabitans endophyticus]
MKLCIVGGGGFRTPTVYRALLGEHASPRVDTVALHDVDTARLDAMVRILAELGADDPHAPAVEATTDLDAAVAGSDFVFAAVRVGGLDGRRCDEHVALDLGVLGQETTGAGGLAFAIRTVPVMMRVARAVARLAPDAYVMNFTNPAGIVTEAMQSVLGDRVLGICDTPSGLARRVAELLGLDPTRVEPDYVGLNHLGWLRGLRHDGDDMLPRLLADDDLLGRTEEARLFGADWIRSLGAVPNEYLHYYYDHREAVAAIVAAPETRGDYLARSQRDFYARVVAEAGPGVAALWRQTVDHRSATYMAEAKADRDAPAAPADEGYAGVALAVMAAIGRGEPATMILNVRNGTTVAGLPADAVVEVPTAVDGTGVHPLPLAPPTLHQLGLLAQVKAVERHVITAALTGSRAEAVTAFALHPLVDSVSVARRLVDGYVAAIPEVAAVLTR